MPRSEPAAFLLGIDIGGTKVDAATATPTGDLLVRERIETRPSDGADSIVARIVELADRLIGQTRDRIGGPCLAVGVATPGIPTDDGVLLSPNIDGWETVRLRERISVALGLPVVAGTDAKLATLAELRQGALKGHRNAIYVSLGTGIGAGLVVDGTLLLGAHGAAGEIGYLAVPVGDGSLELEHLIGGRAIEDSLRRDGALPITAGEALLSDAEAVRGVIDPALAAFGQAIANLATALDPSIVAVGGGLMVARDVILDVLQRALARVPFPPLVVPAHFLVDASLHGALVAAREQGGTS